MTTLAIVSVEWLTQWWNLIFLVPLALGVLYLGLYITTGLTFGEADMDADASGEIEHDVEHDTSVEHHGDHDHHAHASNPLLDVLAWLGANRVPLSLMLMIFAFVWGIAGLSANALLDWLPGPLMALASIPLAFCVSLLLTRWMSKFIGRYMPLDETAARPKEALVGSVGEATTIIDGKFGLVQVRTKAGDLFQLPCRVAGDRPSINKGSRVLLADYDKTQAFFYVVPDELGVTQNAT